MDDIVMAIVEYGVACMNYAQVSSLRPTKQARLRDEYLAARRKAEELITDALRVTVTAEMVDRALRAGCPKQARRIDQGFASAEWTDGERAYARRMLEAGLGREVK